MPLPDDLSVICIDLPWSNGWIEEFGRNNYFYVSNLEETMIRSLRLNSRNQRRAYIRSVANSCNYPAAWLNFFPKEFSRQWHKTNGSEDANNLPESADSFDRELKRLGREVFFTALRGKPVSFSKAALIVQVMDGCLESSAGYSGNIREHLCIDFANWYLEGFEHVYNEHLSGAVDGDLLQRLYVETTQTNRALLEDMARGYPVTKATAESVQSFCKDEFGTNLLIQPYRSRTELQEDRLASIDRPGSKQPRAMRCASGEVVRFRP